METQPNVAIVTLSTGNKHEITQETYEQITLASSDDFILLPDWTSFKKSSVMEIDPIKPLVNNYPQLPAVNYEQIIKSAKKGSHLEALARGLKKAKAKFDRPTPQIDALLQLARDCYKGFKQGKGYNPKYVTDAKSTGYEKAKAAGVF